ncbi:hypothetical protein NCS52_01406400 [Fusarium sp. LHS14.1]|nr:hypothetical protein NCS52_01406400 [Fusarium sp. LHS14.1]
MSQQQTGNRTAPGQAKGGSAPPAKTLSQDCAIIFGDCGPVLASAKSFGLSTKLRSRLFFYKGIDMDSAIGFRLQVPLGNNQTENEASGFGVRHEYDVPTESVVPLDQHYITVNFPRGDVKVLVEEAPKTLADRFPDAKGKHKGMTLINFSLGSRATVCGFGTPFRSTDDEVDGWVNDNKPIIDGHTLLDLLRQQHLYVVVAMAPAAALASFSDDRLPPLFTYPYGEDQSWSLHRFKKEMAASKGHRFAQVLSHPNDRSHVTSVTQSIIQDVAWLDDAATEINEVRFPAYFVPPTSGDAAAATSFTVIVSVTKEFRKQFEASLRRLVKSEFLSLDLFNSFGDSDVYESWQGKILTYTNLQDHPVERHELVLRVLRPKEEKETKKTEGTKKIEETKKPKKEPYQNCASLNFDADLRDHERKVNAVNLFHPEAQPSNLAHCGLPEEDGELKQDLSEDEQRRLAEVKVRMELHRALLRGNGFYDWMTQTGPQDITQAMAAASLDDETAPTLRPLPSVNFLDIEDQAYADAIVEEALPHDRERFRGYLSDRPLGVGIITAGPGFGKTTAGAACTLAMEAKLGKILCSAPTNVAVDNFASRLDKKTRAVTEGYNQGRQLSDATPRRRHLFVLRAYKPTDEVVAFQNLLRKPEDGNQAAPSHFWKPPSKWKLHLSCAFWLLVLLRSPHVRELHRDDSEALHQMQATIDGRKDLENLRSVATGSMTWQEFEKTEGFPATIESVIELLSYGLLAHADLLCTTPAATNNAHQYRGWKNSDACGVAIDEAANMHRADLYDVWGNTLLPCFVFGDPKQLPPTVMTLNDKEPGSDNYRNRFAMGGKISALESLQAAGLPVYRLKTQLRMAKGMFDTVASIIYPDVPFDYDASRDVDYSEFQVGRDLEAFARERFPSLTEAPKGTLKPFFIHCEGSKVFTDETTGSKRSFDQVKIALEFAVDLIKSKKVSATQLVVIAPYAANVQIIKSLRKRYPELEKMQEAMTVDSFQGQENDIAIVVMGTAHPHPGPGFTSDAQRLNVMLTRQKCGLVIVGDIYVARAVERADEKPKEKPKGKGKGKAKAGGEPVFTVTGPTGDISFVKAGPLRKLYKELYDSRRVAFVGADGKEIKEVVKVEEKPAEETAVEKAELEKAVEEVEKVVEAEEKAEEEKAEEEAKVEKAIEPEEKKVEEDGLQY